MCVSVRHHILFISFAETREPGFLLAPGHPRLLYESFESLYLLWFFREIYCLDRVDRTRRQLLRGQEKIVATCMGKEKKEKEITN